MSCIGNQRIFWYRTFCFKLCYIFRMFWSLYLEDTLITALINIINKKSKQINLSCICNS